MDFEEWLSTNGSEVLWLSGPAECCISDASSHVVDLVKEKPSKGQHLALYFFCVTAPTDLDVPIDITFVSTILSQLIHCLPQLKEEITNVFLWALLKTISKETPRSRLNLSHFSKGDSTGMTIGKILQASSLTAHSVFRMNSKDAHTKISTTCIQYLMLCVANTSSIYKQGGSSSWKPENFKACAQYLSRRPYFNYVLGYIDRHLQEYSEIAGNSKLISQLCEKLNESPPAAYLLENWIPQDWGWRIATHDELNYVLF